MPVKPIPDGYHTVTPYLYIREAAKALAFYQKAFGAKEKFRMNGPDGKIAHAEIEIGDSPIMLTDENPQMGARSPQTLGGSGSSLMLYVKDVDTLFKQALAAGAKEIRPLKNQFYGDRTGCLEDPFGHTWTIATHVEDVSQEEVDHRFAEACKKMATA